MRNAVQLITYVDRLGGDIQGVASLIQNELSGLFGGVHLLPYFTPYDGADAGFDPSDHTLVDERLGDWGAIRELSQSVYVMSDIIVNHVADSSSQFRDVLRLGKKSEYWNFFLKRTDIFPEGTSQQEFESIYRPRPGPPFNYVVLENGSGHDFWTTFSPQQLDINVESSAGRAYIRSILERFSEAGIQGVRLDAVGYAIKRRGTSCFMLPETFAYIESLRTATESLGMDVLVEIHSHYQTQIEIARHVSWVYDFALPPLVLHTLYRGNAEALKNWLARSPRNCITVLDTHDGIGIVDVAGDGEHAGLLSDADVSALVDEIGVRTNGQSLEASGHAASNLDIYQVNTTFYDALGRSDRLYLIARAIQFFAPGVPQVYYVGLLAAGNDMELLKRSGVGRDINRHHFERSEIVASLSRPVVQSLFTLIRLRNSAHGFDGDFDMPDCSPNHLHLRWTSGQHSIELGVDLIAATAVITQLEHGSIAQFDIADTVNKVASSEIKQDLE